MNLLLNNQERNKKFTRKEVKKMKRICVLTMGIFFLLGMTIAGATNPHTVLVESTTHVQTMYNAFGIAISATSTSTTITETTDANGKVTTSTTVTTVESTYKNGSIKPDSAHAVSCTRDGSGNVVSQSDSTDTYSYDLDGKLISVSGGGTYNGYDPDTGHTTSGTITRSFMVKDGQALLISSVTSGTMKDKSGNPLGTFTNSTTISEADYQYLGGEWVPMKEVSTSSNSMNNGSSETVTRITTYTRDANGVINGMGQSASGTRIVVTGQNGPGQVASQTFELRNYVATPCFHPQLGWYIASEDYDWVLTTQVTNPPTGGGGGDDSPEPELYGEIVKVNINGVDYIGIKAELIDILDGSGLKNAEGEVWILSGELADKLKDSIGKKVMVMGDVDKQIDSQHYVLKINPEYGGGMVTENVEQALTNYQQSSWYQSNVAMMANVWADVQAKYGSHSDWRQGVEFLMRLFGLGL